MSSMAERDNRGSGTYVVESTGMVLLNPEAKTSPGTVWHFHEQDIPLRIAVYKPKGPAYSIAGEPLRFSDDALIGAMYNLSSVVQSIHISSCLLL